MTTYISGDAIAESICGVPLRFENIEVIIAS